MSGERTAVSIDYGRPTDRRRLRWWLIVSAIAISVVVGGTITIVRVRRELALLAAMLQAQQMASERAILEQKFAAAREEPASLEAAKAELERAGQEAKSRRDRMASRATTQHSK